jgi:hypothetical protein
MSLEDPCALRGAGLMSFAEKPIFNVMLVDGKRRQYFPIYWLYGNLVPVMYYPFFDWLYLRDRAYWPPLWDTSWPDDTLLEFEYF